MTGQGLVTGQGIALVSLCTCTPRKEEDLIAQVLTHVAEHHSGGAASRFVIHRGDGANGDVDPAPLRVDPSGASDPDVRLVVFDSHGQVKGEAYELWCHDGQPRVEAAQVYETLRNAFPRAGALVVGSCQGGSVASRAAAEEHWEKAFLGSSNTTYEWQGLLLYPELIDRASKGPVTRDDMRDALKAAQRMNRIRCLPGKAGKTPSTQAQCSLGPTDRFMAEVLNGALTFAFMEREFAGWVANHRPDA